MVRLRFLIKEQQVAQQNIISGRICSRRLVTDGSEFNLVKIGTKQMYLLDTDAPRANHRGPQLVSMVVQIF